MRLHERIQRIFNVKANAVFDRAEDPRESLEFAYREQLAALAAARRGVVDVLTSEKRLERELVAAQQRLAQQTRLAQEAAAGGEAAGKRRALEREDHYAAQHHRLSDEVAQVRSQRVALEFVTEQMELRADAFRTEKIALIARYAAARTTIDAGETVSGLSRSMEDVAAMVERARAKSEDAQARATALLEFAGRSGAGAVGAIGFDKRPRLGGGPSTSSG